MRFTSGVQLGPFEILAPRGAGGMGEVYRARDTRLDRIVAIKLLPSELVNAPGRRVDRFRHEARAIARITHPNICTLHDIGEDGSAIFLVMEYVEGATLARRLEDGALPLPLALRTAIQIADALDHAHRHGVVHRDLKPGNIMLTRDSVKLLDFGLAKLKERDEHAPTEATKSALTDVGAIVGTVPYMAPEQIEGHEVDARTDIFSFGVVLYEMLSGRRPFAGDSRASLMAAIVAAEPPTLSSLEPRTPAALERLILRCLAKEPDDRWQTARDLAAELRWIAEAGSGASIAAPGPTRRPRRAALWGAAAGTVVTAAAFAAMVPWMWPRPTVPMYRQVTFRRGVVSSARFTPDRQSFVYSASWEGQPYGAFHGRPESPDVRDLQLESARILSISRGGDMAMLFGPQDLSRVFGTRTLARVPMAGGARRDVLTGVVDADWIPGTDTLAVIRDPAGGRPWSVEFPRGTTVHEAPAVWSLRVSPVKLNSKGTALIYAGYIGGSGNEHGNDIALEPGGTPIVTGYTSSTEATFPVKMGPDLTHNGSSNDAFVARVNSTGSGLSYAGYIGGSGGDVGAAVAVDSKGSAYVTGWTSSSETTFPVKIGPDLTHNGLNDVFVAKVSPTGTALMYAGYIGGSDYDFGAGIAVDSTGSAYVTGWTDSDETTFPVKGGPDLTYNGGGDAFVAKVQPAGTTLAYAGYIGGSSYDFGMAIAVDSKGSAYVTGSAESTEATFPVKEGPDLTMNGGFFDAFVAKIKPSGASLVYAGYIGGNSQEQGYGIAVDKNGYAYVTGWARSDQATFPVKLGPDLTYNGDVDAFVAKIIGP